MLYAFGLEYLRLEPRVSRIRAGTRAPSVIYDVFSGCEKVNPMNSTSQHSNLVQYYVIYARYSSKGQNPLSIDDQISACRKFAADHAWKEFKVYSDAAISGAGSDRNGYQQLLRDACSPDRKFSIVLVNDSSRAGRDLQETLKLQNELAFHQVRLIAISQGIDSRNKQAKVLFTVHGLIDELYVEELSAKTHLGLIGCIERNTSTGGRCFGYTTGKHWTVNPDEAAIVVEIFKMNADGYSLKRIAAILNQRGIAPPRPRKGRLLGTWAHTCIREMLRNEIYIGMRTWNRRAFVKKPGTNKRVARMRPRDEWKVVECPDLRIVSDELWNRVQTRQRDLKERYAKPGRVSRAAYSAHLLSGILFCSECNGPLIIISGTGKYPRYGCSLAHTRGACSNRARIKESDLEKILFEQLQREFNNPAVVDSLVDELVQYQRESLNRNSAAERIRTIEGELRNLVANLAQLGLSEAVRDGILQREAELRELRSLVSSKRELSRSEITAEVVSALESIPVLFRKNPLLAKAKLAEHVERITMTPQPDNSYTVEGSWDLLGAQFAPQMVAGAGFEPATFGL